MSIPMIHRKIITFFVLNIFVLGVFIFLSFFCFNYHTKRLSQNNIQFLEYKKSIAQAEEMPKISKEPEIHKLSMIAVGDMMLDRNVFNIVKREGNYGFLFQNISEFLSGFDLRFGNLEGPVTTFQSIAETNRFTFTFSEKYLDPLENNFDILSLANNHTHNFGNKGLEQTRGFLLSKDIVFFGDPNNNPDFLSATIEKNGIKLGLVGYHELINKGFENVLQEIENIKTRVDYVIAFPHWGIEYKTQNPSYKQQQEAYKMIDAGVDLIIGTHPHVIQPIEIYRDKIIFYSLGNFIFDQYFSKETMQGLTVGIDFEKKNDEIKTEYKLYPVNITRNSQPELMSDEEMQIVFDSLSELSIVSSTVKENLNGGFIEPL